MKIKEWINKNYRVLIPGVVIIVLLIAIFFLYHEYKYDNFKNKENLEAYQYTNGIKSEYEVVVTRNLRNRIVDVKGKNHEINFTNTPLYYEEDNRVIFLNEMNVVFPLKSGIQYKMYKYGTFYTKDEMNYLINETKENYYNYFFLTDGNSLYFFPTDVLLKIDNREIQLSKMSYVSVVGSSLIYFNYETKDSELIELNKSIVNISNSYIDLDPVDNSFKVLDKKILIFKPANLHDLNEINTK